MTFLDALILSLWTLLSGGSVLYALVGERRSRRVRNEALADLEMVQREEASALEPLALLQSAMTRGLVAVQRLFLAHQALFLLAGLASFALNVLAPEVRTAEESGVAGLIRQVAIPFDLVIAQALIVVGQVFLQRVVAALSRMYRRKIPPICQTTLSEKIEEVVGEAAAGLEEEAKEVRERLEKAESRIGEQRQQDREVQQAILSRVNDVAQALDEVLRLVAVEGPENEEGS